MVREFAQLYEALAQRSVPPRDADQLEVWEAAAVLGLASGEGDEASRPLSDDVRRLREGPAAESPMIVDPDRLAELRAAVGQVHRG